MKTIIVASALYNWGETHRMVGIGEELKKRGYRIVYLGEGKYDYMVDETDFERVKVPGDEEWFTPERIKKMMDIDTYVNNYATADEILKTVKAEVEVMKKYNPVMVVTGYRTTLSISARVLKVPLVWVLSSVVSKNFFLSKIDSLPEKSILNRYFNKDKMNQNKEVMLGFIKKMFSIYNESSAEWNKVNEMYGLKKFESDLDIFEGELNIASDPPEFGEEGDGYKYCGPIFHKKRIEMPEVAADIDSITKKKIFIVMGSSGTGEDFERVLKNLDNEDYEYYVSSGRMTEEEKKKYPENFHFADAYPVYEMAGKVDACITHGGQGTIYSVLAAGKPFIGIPLFMEQQYNLETMQKKHYGILLPKDKVTKETIEEALDRAFTDKELIEGAKEGGEIVRKYLIDPEYSAESKAAEIIKEYLDEKTD